MVTLYSAGQIKYINIVKGCKFSNQIMFEHTVTFRKQDRILLGHPLHNRHCDPLTRRCGCDFGFIDVRGECVSEIPEEDYIDRWAGDHNGINLRGQFYVTLSCYFLSVT